MSFSNTFASCLLISGFTSSTDQSAE
jgi:hypothetical protein